MIVPIKCFLIIISAKLRLSKRIDSFTSKAINRRLKKGDPEDLYLHKKKAELHSLRYTNGIQTDKSSKNS